MPQPRLQFWYEFASTYSYLSAMRIGSLAANIGVDIDWRPFLLGPIFKAQGWDTSPFNIYPSKGRYMERDIARMCDERELTFSLPDPFPANGLLAARVAHCGQEADWCEAFTKGIYLAQFATRKKISDVDVVRETLTSALSEANSDVQADSVMDAATSTECKDGLRTQTEAAEKRGLFGAPSFVTENGEVFWGDDRLEHALTWALNE